MCDFGDKLIAWLDGEVCEDEAAEIERHTHACEECRRCIASYKQISGAIVSHCDARFASRVQPQRLPWAPLLSLAAAAAVIFFVVRHGRPEQRPSQRQVSEVAHAVAEMSAKALVEAPRMTASKPAPGHRSVRAAVPIKPQEAQQYVQNANWVPAESAVQITIPAESMFAPGAVPQGVSFSAELILAADGSAQSIRLHP